MKRDTVGPPGGAPVGLQSLKGYMKQDGLQMHQRRRTVDAVLSAPEVRRCLVSYRSPLPGVSEDSTWHADSMGVGVRLEHLAGQAAVPEA